MLRFLHFISEYFQWTTVLRTSVHFPNILMFSSLIFITNCATCFIYNKIIHCVLFFLLTCSSLLVHYNDNIITNVFDKIIIAFVFLNGLMLILTKENENIFIVFIVLTFLFVVFVYIYGYVNDKYVFDKNIEISKTYHVFMHLIASFGHHLIVL
jgi:hypothetical protein